MRSIIHRVVLFLFVSTAALGQDVDPRVAAFRTFAESAMKAQQVQGLSVAVSYGDFHWSGGLGLADIENRVPATASTSYRMASCAKPMTAVAVLKLADEGKIDLDAEVQAYVPWFPKKEKPITVRQLLAHQSGISHYRDYEKEGHIRDPKSTREAIAIFADFDLVAEPGSAYRYTSYGYNLLGAVIEGATGRPYAALMTEKVWKPLGMSATLMDDPRAVIPNRAPGYVLEDGKLRRSEYVDVSSRFAAGGTRSTVDDMIRFLEGLAAGKVLEAETLDRAWTTLPTRNGTPTPYGLGFGVYPRNGRWVVGHTGAQQETRTAFALAPHARFAVALASNFEQVDLDVFEDKLFEIFLGDAPLNGLAFDSEADDRAWQAMLGAYSHGMAWYDRHGRAMTSDERELSAAFRAFHEALTGDARTHAAGRNALERDALLKVGSYVASVLAANGGLDRYHHEGALPFFEDYARTARRHRLDRSVVGRIAAWSDARARLWSPEVLSLDLRDRGALDVLERNSAALAKAPVKPDYTRELVDLAQTSAMRGDFPEAARTAKVGQAIYPRSQGLNGILGVLTLLGGDRATAMGLLQRSKELDPRGYVGPENLVSIASFLARGPMKPAAITLLEAGVELHPADEKLRARLAEMKNPH